MKNFKRILSLLLAVVMTLGTAVIAGAADVSFTDVSNHWAWTGGQIPYLVSKNVLNGYKQSDGTYTFKPDGEVTRAEFIKMLDETFGLKKTAPVPFSDVADTDWFAPYIAKAVAQGYLLNYGTSIEPNAKLTREEAISLLVRYLDLSAEYLYAPDFTDYYSISENLRTYIMEAVTAGVTEGYPDKTFQPKRILTRAEALTILFRAAGAIYNGTVSSRDYGAAGTNNTFVSAGSTVISGVNFEGRNIITEGAESGTLTFQNCKFIGPLTVRGDADVIFYNCTANDVTLQGSGIFSLLDRSKVTSLRVEKSAGVNVNSATTVTDMTVASTASGLTVRGDGAIGNISVQASGLVSAIMPATFDIARGLTAVFAGTEAMGNSQEMDSFLAAPFVFADGTNASLAVKPSGTGIVYVYYTNEEVTPSASLFESHYEAAEHAFYFRAAGSVWSSGSAFAMSDVSRYEYMVVQLQQEERKYRPILVPCAYVSNTGFAADPVLNNSTLTVRAEEGGTIWWYFADNASKVSAVDFLNNWDNMSVSRRGTGTVRANTDFNITVKDTDIRDYGYVVLLLKNNANGYFTPLIFGVGNTGFSDGPAVKTAGTIRYKARESGSLFYYFTDSDSAPTADQFLGEYNAAEYRYEESIKISVDSEFRFDLSLINKYPYVVIAIRTPTGQYLQPVLLKVDVDTGFDLNPAYRVDGEIRYSPKYSGTVKYYYTTSSSAPTSEEFNNVYRRTDDAHRGSIRATANGRVETIHYYLQYVSTTPYMVFMLTDTSGQDYSPVLVELRNASGTGFKTAPYTSGNEIVFTTDEDGMVYMFYTTDPSAMAAEDFYDEYRSSRYRNSTPTLAGIPSSMTIDSEAKKINRYAVLAFLPSSSRNNTLYFKYPYILDLEGGTADLPTETGLKVSVYPEEKRVYVTSEFAGTLAYYFTDYETELPTGSVSSFDSFYRSVSGAKSESVTAGQQKKFDTGSYRYAVFCLTAKSDKETKSYAPYIVDMGAGREYTGGIDDNATMKSTGFKYARIDTRTSAVFATEVSGTVELLAKSGSLIQWTGIKVHADAGKETTIDLPDLSIIAYAVDGFYLQLTADTGEVYKSYPLTNNN